MLASGIANLPCCPPFKFQKHQRARKYLLLLISNVNRTLGKLLEFDEDIVVLEKEPTIVRSQIYIIHPAALVSGLEFVGVCVQPD